MQWIKWVQEGESGLHGLASHGASCAVSGQGCQSRHLAEQSARTKPEGMLI